MMGGGTGAYALHWSGGAARCVRSHIPGALSILKGAVPDRARGLGHMAPTYFRREPGIDALTAIAAPHFDSLLPFDGSRLQRHCRCQSRHPPGSARPPRWPAGRHACRRRPGDRGAPVSDRHGGGCDRLRLHAAEERDQSHPADAQTRGCRRATGAARDRRTRAAAHHARLFLRAAAGVGSLGHPRTGARCARGLPRYRDRAACWPSTAVAIASVTAPATTT